MEFIPNALELKILEANKLTVFREDLGHYELQPQRGCFNRCRECVNLSEAESTQEKGGAWQFTTECEFCVQRLIDLLGWYEHKKVPTFTVSGRPKKQEKTERTVYDAIMDSVSNPTAEEMQAAERGVFDDYVGEDE